MNVEQQQIQTAVRQGDYAKAEGLIEKVLQEHPNSAKAHYLHARILAHSHQLVQAGQEVAAAKSLDPHITFTSPETFGQFEAYLNAATHQQTHALAPTQAMVAVTPRPAAASAAPSLWPVAGGVVLLLLVVYAVFRMFSRRNEAPLGQGYGGAPGTGYGPASGGTGGTTVVNTGPAPGAGAGTAIAAGLGGLAAGMLLERALDNRDGGLRGGAPYVEPSGVEEVGVPNYAEQQLDEMPFDMGTDDGGWADSSSDGGGFDTGNDSW